jgi:hypothetical protein
MADKLVKKYFENMPYGEDSTVSEIHGKHNQEVINSFVSGLVRNYDIAMQEGDKIRAGKFYNAVTKIEKDLSTLKGIKEEFAMNYGGGVGGKNIYSNWTDLTWDRAFFTEQGKINFDENMNLLLVTKDPNSGEESIKKIEDITENWVIKGSGENTYMTMQQDAVKQRNTMGIPLDFDVDYAVGNLLAENDNWKSFVSDKIGGRYFLQDYMEQNAGMLMEMGSDAEAILHLESFNPEVDKRLHEYFSDRIKKSFDPSYKSTEVIDDNEENTENNENDIVQKTVSTAKQLMDRIKNKGTNKES